MFLRCLTQKSLKISNAEMEIDMKKLKRTIGVLLAVLMLVPSVLVQAGEGEIILDEVPDEIEKLLEQRAGLVMLGEYDELDDIDCRLEELGIHKLSEQEAMEFITEHSDISTYVTKPSDGAITWYTGRETLTYNGTDYEIQTLLATPNAKDSSLKGALSGSGKELNSTYQWQAAAMNLLKTTATGYLGQKISGFEKAWTAYELIKPFVTALQPTSEVISTTVMYSYSWTATVSFKYVKKVGESDDYQAMTYVSSKCEAVVAWNCPTFYCDATGVAHPDILQGKQNLSGRAVGYNSNYNAVKAYVDPTAPRSTYVNYIEVTGIEEKTVFAIWLPTPSSPLLLLDY